MFHLVAAGFSLFLCSSCCSIPCHVILWEAGLYTQEKIRVKSPGMIMSINLALWMPPREPLLWGHLMDCVVFVVLCVNSCPQICQVLLDNSTIHRYTTAYLSRETHQFLFFLICQHRVQQASQLTSSLQGTYCSEILITPELFSSNFVSFPHLICCFIAYRNKNVNDLMLKLVFLNIYLFGRAWSQLPHSDLQLRHVVSGSLTRD